MILYVNSHCSCFYHLPPWPCIPAGTYSHQVRRRGGAGVPASSSN